MVDDEGNNQPMEISITIKRSLAWDCNEWDHRQKLS
jgi:hypothetical protein